MSIPDLDLWIIIKLQTQIFVQQASRLITSSEQSTNQQSTLSKEKAQALDRMIRVVVDVDHFKEFFGKTQLQIITSFLWLVF